MMNDQDKTQGEQTKQVPGSADHAPEPATPEAKAMHGDKARGEVFDQPEAVVLDGDTRIATEPQSPETGESRGVR